jgi:signal transduction histidine kinase
MNMTHTTSHRLAHVGGIAVAVRYGLAVLMPVAVLVLREWVASRVSLSTHFSFFYPVVFLAAYFLGTGPALVSTALSAGLVEYFVLRQARVLPGESTGDMLGELLFVFSCGIIVVLCDSRRRHIEEAHAPVSISERQRRDLVEMNRQLEQFAARAAHDLKQPLNSIVMGTELLMRLPAVKADADCRELAEPLIQDARRAARIVDSALRLARSRSRPLQRETVDLADVVNEAATALRMTIRDTGAVVRVGDLPSLCVDRTLISEVFQNLISNAIKFRRPGGCTIHIDSRRRNSDWLIVVNDNGIGFDAATAEKLFEYCERGDDMQGLEGSGIGLSVCKRIVERHGGRIWAESNPSQGATFYFQLPATAPPATARLPAERVQELIA